MMHSHTTFAFVFFINCYLSDDILVMKMDDSLFSFLFFSIQTWEKGKKEKGKIYKGESLPLVNMIEEMKGEIVGMLLNTRWEATHPATRCASILAHLEILRTLQIFMECN
jgi:hypothetical protein